MPTTAHHEIEVKLVGGHPVPTIPSNLNHGETVHYFSKDGLVIILFPDGTPFVDATGADMPMVTSLDPALPLSKTNTNPGFACRCYLTPAGGTTVGWSPDYPVAGGNHVVH